MSSHGLNVSWFVYRGATPRSSESKSAIDFRRAESLIELVADDNFKMTAVWEMLTTRMVRRGVPVKNLKPTDVEPTVGGLVKRTVSLQQGIPTDTARAIVKFLKDHKLRKVQAAIQGDQVRVSSPSKDELQAAIALLKAEDFGLELLSARACRRRRRNPDFFRRAGNRHRSLSATYSFTSGRGL